MNVAQKPKLEMAAAEFAAVTEKTEIALEG
jgi:hypothetical protein